MFSQFIINRPIFCSVISIVIVLAGVISIPTLPIAQYPEIAPPTVQVVATYRGANAQTVAQTVTTPIEEQINGVEGMISISSTSTDNGVSTITVTFEIGYDLDIAAVDVQNRVAMAQSSLPSQVIDYGIDIKKKSSEMVLMLTMISPDNSRDLQFISNYASIYVVDSLKRVPGVGSVTIFGERTYAMRIWLDVETMAGYGITSADVSAAIQAQNVIAPVGSIGMPPSGGKQVMDYVVQAKGRLSSVEEFEQIIVRTNDDGSLIYLKDLAQLELGAENYMTSNKFDATSTVGLGVYQLPDANSLKVAERVSAAMEELKRDFPSGVDYQLPFDTTDFVREAVSEVVWTLLIALALVIVVVFVFLQSWRVTLIPVIAIPVSIVGTFALIAAMGFSINLLTLFGLVLAIGLVVDDAIVVVENISRLMEDEGMSAKDAALKSMGEVFGPVTASTLVMMAVFIPAAFMPGLTGQLYQQFALTIACSLALSWIVAMSFAPSMSAKILKQGSEAPTASWAKAFNKRFDALTERYMKAVKVSLKRRRLALSVLAVISAVTAFMFFWVPTGFVPEEDEGYVVVSVQMPSGTALDRAQQIVDGVAEIIRSVDGVEHTAEITGFDLLTGSSIYNAGTIFVLLEDYDQRNSDSSADNIIKKLRVLLSDVEGGLALPFNAPPIQGLSSTGGFEFVVEDRAGAGEQALWGTTWAMIGYAKQHISQLSPMFSTFQVDSPRLYVDIDAKKAMQKGVALSDIYQTMQANLGSMYINDFNKYNQTYKVYIQAKQDQRSSEEDIGRLYVRNYQHEMIPLSEFVQIERQAAANIVTRYNLFNAAHVMGAPAPGHSSGQAMFIIEKLSEKMLPSGFGYEWTGVAYQQEKAGNTAPLIFGLALILVFLIIAALYESWILPAVILLSVPLAMFGALSFQWLRGLQNDVYCQIALIMLIGLAAKNAILIVQFANDKVAEGKNSVEAVLYACKTRLRPILMTAFAFILGVAPLVVATGAGAGSRHSLGTAVFGGMLLSTILSLLIVPVLYVVFERWRESKSEPEQQSNQS
ncbi:efflux RND transporter permease subunit [Agaribacterium haliotis]|uniref:efflux RND transporter permease subunit n=1 Tax=Agaribacterium haliotis TaxID=2013869 RepID=UPI000BB53FFB|nr:multidrug efflux RND transporter permease subunit [Agaribacterium haliotis]